MGRKPRVDRTPEEVADRARRDEGRERFVDLPEIRHRSDALLPIERRGTGSESSACGRSAAAAETEKHCRIRQLERTLGRKFAGDRNPKKTSGNSIVHELPHCPLLAA